MRLSIEHETHFRFGAPATHSIQYLRLTPRADPCQNVRRWRVSVPGNLSAWADGFDNPAHVAVQDGEHDEVVVTVTGQVDTVDTNGILPLDDGLPPGIFLRQTEQTAVDTRVQRFARKFKKTLTQEGTLAFGHELMNGVADTVTYQPGLTTVETPASAALKAGVGVCQDQAHVFIASARHMDIPARYVSGYILAGQGNDSHLASHAWAELLIDQLGWVSFDPANRQSATDAYVRLAVGLDYATACPVRGLRQGGGLEEMDVKVQVQNQ